MNVNVLLLMAITPMIAAIGIAKNALPERDRIVPISASQEMVEALKACGGNVKFTVYSEAEHDSWTQTYNNPELFDWFRQHQRDRLARSS